tara:strand:- start:94 stop:696 length:603 start_codon:yes stop_codon:yes gene_type:complete
MNEPDSIIIPWPTEFRVDWDHSWETAVWIDQDYWLEAFEGKSGHLVVPSTCSWEWGFEKQGDVVYWIPYEDKGPDYMHEYDVHEDVLFSVLGADHPFMQNEAPAWETNGKLTYFVTTLDLHLSESITNEDMWNIVHATMRSKTYVGMRCLSITGPYVHPDVWEKHHDFDIDKDEMPHEQYAIACGLDPARTHVDTHWTGG